jgi:acetyltransferase-like isoleucine patch superfamily enzyme
MHISSLIYRAITKFNKILITIKIRFYYQHIFRHFGQGSSIRKPIILNNPQNIFIGDHVTILHNAWLSGPPNIKGHESILKIANNSAIGNYCHIYATTQIIIEEKVLIADKVYISDNMHNYKNIALPIIDQGINQLSVVNIGQGSWIGENVCIIGASIGKNCVIGANAVVNKDIPDYSVAVGIPAKVIKRYNNETGVWQNAC